jgi:hypothetical protein
MRRCRAGCRSTLAVAPDDRAGWLAAAASLVLAVALGYVDAA